MPTPTPDQLRWITTMLRYVDDARRPIVFKFVGHPAHTIRQSASPRIISVLGVPLRVSHIVWYLHHGVWPSMMIDYINDDIFDDRIGNLQEMTRRDYFAKKRVKSYATIMRRHKLARTDPNGTPIQS